MDDETAAQRAESNDQGQYYMFHRPCHGKLIVGDQTAKQRADDDFDKNNYGLTMAEYLEKYERKRRMKVEAKDRQLLKQLTTTTLFCPHCYRPFLQNDKDDKLMSSAYRSMLDYLSAIMFVVIPIAWIPLILLFAVLTLKEKFFEWVDSEKAEKDGEQKKKGHSEYDQEYVPKRNYMG